MRSPNPATSDSPRQSTSAFLLPPKIVQRIVDLAPNSSIKNLRLTCRYYSQKAALRLDRVFISANPRNVEVFTAIAEHSVFRAQITEIIWDDALLYVRRVPDADEYASSDEEYEDETDEDGEWDKYGINWRGKVPGWFRKACRENVSDMRFYCGVDVDRPSLIARAQQLAEQMPMEEAWAYYQKLLEQQRDVLNSKAHINALEKHVGSFPELQRITITAATHGRLYNPLYETPMIRAFPCGFNHYIPRCWPVPNGIIPECDPWDEDGSDWQGFRVVTRLLAEGRDLGRVTDLCVDAHELEMGLNSRVFERENRTLHDFEAVLKRPNFTHLQLDLMVDPDSEQVDVLSSGLLRRALAGGRGLEYLSFRTCMEICRRSDSEDFHVPLRTIFTPTSHPRLQHFGIAHLYVKQDDVLALLTSMPKTLRSVELSTIRCIDGKSSYQTLLWAIRDKLGWAERDPRPTLTISTELQNIMPGRAVWLDDELYDFLYQGGRNPFGDDETTKDANDIDYGFGWEEDSFEPDHERPHVDLDDLADMGYVRRLVNRSGGNRTTVRPVRSCIYSTWK
ncbi:hypothetical protein V498_06888 [Pseudogymnoascus sp. VKM F-4517 (FW-2822)]|nr:hypothetical protein V498_06888 [Pseudogymnoascus sp. VKM F-4517 (FW-2822)]